MTDRRRYQPMPVKSTELPADWVRMVTEVLSSNFDAGLRALSKEAGAETRFLVSGAVYPDEILVRVTLQTDRQIAATTMTASADFDPKASSPRAEDLLGACVDALGALLGHYLDENKPESIRQLASDSMSALDNAPFEWALQEVDRFKVYLRMDKSNPALDAMTDDWLAKNDPDHAKNQERERAQMESLFVTGKRSRDRADS